MPGRLSIRENLFLIVVCISFLYDLLSWLGIRDAARFPHPFVVFSFLGDIELLSGFPAMIRQAIFYLVVGGFLGVTTGVLILKNTWLTFATIEFLRVALWFPFFALYAIHDIFKLGISAITLCTMYHYLTAHSRLEINGIVAMRYVSREAIVQALLFVLIAQPWSLRWPWLAFVGMQELNKGIGVFVTVLLLMWFINWVFKADFQVIAGGLRSIWIAESHLATRQSWLAVLLLTIIWLTLWQVSSWFLGYSKSSPFAAVGAFAVLPAGELWNDFVVSMAEAGGGLVFGALIAYVIASLLTASHRFADALRRFLPSLAVTVIPMWVLIPLLGDRLNLPQTIFPPFPSYGHKICGVALMVFLPFLQALWSIWDQALLRRVAVAIEAALPMAFVGMLFGELFASTAGLGFMMVVAGATYEYQKGLAGFLLIAGLILTLSTALRSIIKRFDLGHA